jgi:DNA-directed RNA polymerase specialized sigma24 family protein
MLDEGRKRLIERLNDPVLLRRILRYLIARHEFPKHKADDVTQDTFLRAQRAKNWPAENAPLYPWLRRYANYARASRTRSKASNPPRSSRSAG